MVMARRGERNPHPSSNGRHVKPKLSIRISERNLRRLVIALFMCCSALSGAITQLALDRGWLF